MWSYVPVTISPGLSRISSHKVVVVAVIGSEPALCKSMVCLCQAKLCERRRRHCAVSADMCAHTSYDRWCRVHASSAAWTGSGATRTATRLVKAPSLVKYTTVCSRTNSIICLLFNGRLPGEPQSVGSSLVFFLHLFQKRTFGICDTGFYRPDVLNQ